jgi:hypothetical protein
MATLDQKKKASIKAIPFWYSFFESEGINPELIPMLISKLAFESGYFTSNTYVKNNNPGGITWNRNYATRPGASIGIKRPANEGGNYVNFDTLKNAGKDYLRIISRKGRAGSPIEANTIPEFVRRLKANGYFAGDTKTYLNGLLSINKRFEGWVNYATLQKKNPI